MPEPAEPPKAVRVFLDQDAGGVLVDGPDLTPGPAPGDAPRVAVVRRDLAQVRAEPAATGLRTPVLGLYLREGPQGVPLVPRPEWPALISLRTRRAQGGWWTVLRFAEPVDVDAVLAEVGRQAVWGLAVPVTGGGHDVRVINPIGFLGGADVVEPAVALADLDLRHGVTPGLVARLRPVLGVHAGDVGRLDAAGVRAVEALALAGVPVTATAASSGPLSSILGEALTAAVDLADPMAREEHSLVLRRAAFDAFSGWAQRHPPVSILLATRRAEMLDFALAQVARQRGVASLELVLAPHGFDVPVARVQEAVGPGVAVQVLPHEGSVLFGDVLEAAARAARGRALLKMDDDDWYAPDVVADLLRARAYSGAELVGMSAELHYLTGRDLTVHRGHPTERYVRFVAGGTMLIDRAVLREVGGFRRVRKYVDAQLIEAVLAAGGAVYRTHGLGYVLRRNPTGHTWEVDDDYLLDPRRVATLTPGFRPSRLMEPDPRHLP